MKNFVKFLFIIFSLYLVSTPSQAVTYSHQLIDFLINSKVLKLVTNIFAYRTKEDLNELNEAINLENKEAKKKIKIAIRKYLKKSTSRKNNKLIREHLSKLDALTDDNYTNLSLLLALGDLDFQQDGALSKKSKNDFLSIALQKSDGSHHDLESLQKFFTNKFKIGNNQHSSQDTGTLFSKDISQGHQSIKARELSEMYPENRFVNVKMITGKEHWFAVKFVDGKEKASNLNQIDLSEEGAEYFFYPKFRGVYEDTSLSERYVPETSSIVKNTKPINATNAASRGRDLAIAANRFQLSLNNTYPDSFQLQTDDQNMFSFTLEGVCPAGIYKGTKIKLKYDFSNVSNEGPKITIIDSPPNAHKYGKGLCLVNAIPFSEVLSYWEYYEVKKYSSHIFPIEQQFLNPLMFLMKDDDILSEGILYGVNGDTPPEEIAEKIHSSLERTSNNPNYIPDKGIILKRLRKAALENNNERSTVYQLIPKEDRIQEITFPQDSFSPDVYDIKGNRTNFFLPMNLTPFGKVIEFNAKEISSVNSLMQQVYAYSDQALCKNQYVDIYVDGKKISEENLIDELQKLVEENKAHRKHSKKHDKLALISYFDPKSYQDDDEWDDTVLELHLYANKSQAKRSNRTREFSLDIPQEAIRSQERFNGGLQYGKMANAWVPDISQDMSETEKQTSMKATAEFGKHYLGLPNEPDAYLSWKTNEIVLKSMMGPLVDETGDWLPTEAFMQLLLSRIRMATKISSTHDKLLAKTQANFDDCLKGTINKNTLPDFAYLPVYLNPVYSQLTALNFDQKADIRRTIFINAIKECLVRILTYAAKEEKNYDNLTLQLSETDKDDFSEILKIKKKMETIETIRSFYKNPYDIDLNAIENINKTGIGYLVNILSIMDAVFANESIEQFPDKDLEKLQSKIKSIRCILNDYSPGKLKRIIDQELKELIDLTPETEKNLVKDVLTEFFHRNKKNQTDIPIGYEKTEDNSSSQSLKDLVESIDRVKPKLFTNETEDLGGGMHQCLQTCRHCFGLYTTKNQIKGRKQNGKYDITPLHSECSEPFRKNKQASVILWDRIKKNDNKPQYIAPKRNDYHVIPTNYHLIPMESSRNHDSISALHQAVNRLNPDNPIALNEVKRRLQHNLSSIKTAIDTIQDKDKQRLLKTEFSELINVPLSVIDELVDNQHLSHRPSEYNYNETSPYSVLLSFNPLPVMAISDDLDIEIKVPDMSPIRRTAQNDWLLKAPNLLNTLNKTRQLVTNPRLKSINDKIETNLGQLETLQQKEKDTLDTLKAIDQNLKSENNNLDEKKDAVKQLQKQLAQTRREMTALKDASKTIAHKHSENSSDVLLVRYDHDAGYPSHYDLAIKKNSSISSEKN